MCTLKNIQDCLPRVALQAVVIPKLVYYSRETGRHSERKREKNSVDSGLGDTFGRSLDLLALMKGTEIAMRSLTLLT